MQVKNNSGWCPQGSAVLLRACELSEKAGKDGVIIIPEKAAMSSATCETMGIVVAIGADAWKDCTPRAKIGEKVLVTQYSGGVIKGRDGYVYKMIPSHAIYATEDEETYEDLATAAA